MDINNNVNNDKKEENAIILKESCSYCFGTGAIRSKIKTYTYDENKILQDKSIRGQVVRCPKCLGIKEC